MLHPQENKQCYLSEIQREVLLQLLTEPTIEAHFFLTGGTALAVFYLYHRVSNDLDLFALTPQNLAELHVVIQRMWPRESVVIKQSPNFLSCLIQETKVDLVIDPLSRSEERPAVLFENGRRLQIDTIQSIVANKLCACVSRTEPKDYIDLYGIFKKLPELRFEIVYAGAQAKDAMFDDPPTVAFQLEEGLGFLKDNRKIFPRLRIALDDEEFFAFYASLVKWIYDRTKP
jgi:predicted nucleotidyltransferase component of viral defense system